ncbi:nuclear transport factor 2 family protein [Pseudonocardia sp. TRM90224]|uniref:nuclear transport factor 2 family protein n=1 Tax=Pseudonocardia sp. TRM90224 TaxID=2812678 RepID=UPI001E51BAE9|nr:nuclear transport factor 2 family protein [Pseudonocardia sp. TRM90224]
MPLSPREVFLKLVNGVADQDVAALPQLYAEHTDVRHPMAPLGIPPLTTRAELRKHFERPELAQVARLRVRPADIVVHETADPEVIVAEFSYAGTHPETGEAFAVPCVFVMRVRDGEIVESRDYVDHLRFARLRGQLDDLWARLHAQARTKPPVLAPQ